MVSEGLPTLQQLRQRDHEGGALHGHALPVRPVGGGETESKEMVSTDLS